MPGLARPTKHLPLGNPSLPAVDSVFRLAWPPLQVPNAALAGDTVTERMVGTVVSDRLMLADCPAPCGAAPVIPQPATAVPATARTTQAALRLIATPAAGHAGRLSFDPDPDA